jgi:hypothetical protein
LGFGHGGIGGGDRTLKNRESPSEQAEKHESGIEFPSKPFR